jgi:adenylate cyclase
MTQHRALSNDRPSVAVLPFASLDPTRDNRFFSDGVTEDIITELSRFRELLIVGGSSSFACEPFAEDIARIGRELDVRYVLRGSIRRTEDRVRVSCHLISAPDGAQLWADRNDAALSDLFDMQAEIAARIATSIVGEIERAEQHGAEHRGMADAAAYDLALKASALIGRGIAPTDVDLLTQGIELAEEALSVDRTCRRALAALAFGHCRRGVVSGIDPSHAEDLEAAVTAARRLRELDPLDHWSHAILGHIAMRRLAHDEAIANLRRAHELNPNDVTALRWLSWEESNLGDFESARSHARLALRLGPRDRMIDVSWWVLALAEYVAGANELCLEYVRRAAGLNQQFAGHRLLLIANLVECGELQEARVQLVEARKLAPGLIDSRLNGRSYFPDPKIATRYHKALLLAAGDAASGAATSAPASSAGVLTRREQEILRLVAKGLSNPLLAEHLHLSEHTVKRHVANILTKLALPTRAAAVAEAARLGLLG